MCAFRALKYFSFSNHIINVSNIQHTRKNKIVCTLLYTDLNKRPQIFFTSIDVPLRQIIQSHTRTLMHIHTGPFRCTHWRIEIYTLTGYDADLTQLCKPNIKFKFIYMDKFTTSSLHMECFEYCELGTPNLNAATTNANDRMCEHGWQNIWLCMCRP